MKKEISFAIKSFIEASILIAIIFIPVFYDFNDTNIISAIPYFLWCIVISNWIGDLVIKKYKNKFDIDNKK